MSKEITLDYPSGGAPLPSGPLVAYGTATGAVDVRGLLKDTKQRLIAEAVTLQRPPRWIVYFASLEVLPGDYLLEVSEAGVRIPVSVVRRLTFAGPHRQGVHIDHPGDGALLPGDQLVAHGTTDQNLRLSGTLTIPTAAGPVVRSAEQVFGPPESPHWVIAFADLPAATGPARLEVFASGGLKAMREGLRLQ